MSEQPPEPELAPEEVDRRLAADPLDLAALLARADYLARAGERRAAGAAYHAAARSPDKRFGANAPERARAAQGRDALQRAYIDHLYRSLDDAGMAASQLHPRFAKALALMTGQSARAPATTRWPSQPRLFFYPDLAAVDFVDPQRFDWATALEAQTDAIADELGRLLGDGSGFDAYVSDKSGAARNDYHGMLGNTDWSSHHLVENGQRHAAPESPTMEALAPVPLCDIDGRTPSVLFSLLKAGAHIPPHTGMLNFRYICHLPLIVPGDGALRVGGETREWERGRLLMFDDTVEHEAWNRSGSDRVVLIFDIWNPSLEDEEKAQLRALFAAVDSF